MPPWIRIFGWLLVAGGASTLVWYHQLSPAKQAEADELLADYAMELYEKKVQQLTATEAKYVHTRASHHFSN